MIDYNMLLLNHNDLPNSFFQTDETDSTIGFTFDATAYCGPTYPSVPQLHGSTPDGALQHVGLSESALRLRLILGSHLANYLRMYLEEQKRYTATVGISTSKLLSKLAGNVYKPRNQTTLVPPYTDNNGHESNVTRFLDNHDIGQIPGIGYKIAQRLRPHVLGRETASGHYEVLHESDRVSVGAVRSFPKMGPLLLDDILRGGVWPNDIGSKVWRLLNGIDDAKVASAAVTPTQISIEDSYSQLDKLEDVQNALTKLAYSLIRRMRIDLTEDDDDIRKDTAPQDTDLINDKPGISVQKRWLAHPRTLRLSTRVRLLTGPDGSGNTYSAPRVSRSRPMPQFVFALNEDVESLAERLVREALSPTFRKVHPEMSGWKLSLINVAATNMVNAAGTAKTSAGRDIGKMFRTQEHVLREWKVEDRDVPPDSSLIPASAMNGENKTDETSADLNITGSGCAFDWNNSEEDGNSWESDDDSPMPSQPCRICNAFVPHFALEAHEMYHTLGD